MTLKDFINQATKEAFEALEQGIINHETFAQCMTLIADEIAKDYERRHQVAEAHNELIEA